MSTVHPLPVRAYIGLGSNLTDPCGQLLHAFAELGRLPRSRLIARSSLYRSAPVGYADQPDFINAVAEIETGLGAHELLAALLDLERRHGRVREFRNGPRTLDLDVLLYDGLVCHEGGLTLPHPRMHERAFVLRPLQELAPALVIPGRGALADCLAACADQELERFEEPVLGKARVI
jgi:2-amino-4-hydroxy-6-hydroxymethyldihydropteridine diphosphokinase